jgi:lipoprotein NlpI
MLLVDGDTAALLRAARASRTPLEAQTEAQFFIGEHLAIKGDTSAARNAWKQAVELGVTEYIEHSAARQRLARQPR